MKQVYKKKPEYMEVIYITDDTQCIKDVYEMAGVDHANISFDENGNRVIILDAETNVKLDMVLFKDKKTGKLVCTTQDKLLQFYDLCEPDKVKEPDSEPKPEKKRNTGLRVSDGRGIGGEVEE